MYGGEDYNGDHPVPYGQPMYDYRQPMYQPPRPAEFYNTDTGTKTSLAKKVETSGRRYAIMGSKCPRFRDTYNGVPAADYNIDKLHKKGVATQVQDSKQLYAASFSRSGRWGRAQAPSEAPDVHYETDYGPNASLYKCVETAPRKFANMKSKASRFGPKPGVGPGNGAPLDIAYETDVLGKSSLETSVKTSYQKYSVMRSKQPKFRKDNVYASGDLGPGSYDTPCLLDMKKDWTNKPHSSFLSGVSRLKSYYDPSKNLGSTYTPEHDRKAWVHGGNKGHKFSTAIITRPSYLPSVYDKPEKKK